MEIAKVDFCDSAARERHKARLAALVGSEAKRRPANAPLPKSGERWSVVAEWDASNRVPKRGDGKRVNPPALVAWSPKGDRLFTSNDTWGLTSWDVNGRRLSAETDDAAWGPAGRLFVTQLGDDCRVLQENETSSGGYLAVHNDRCLTARSSRTLAQWGYFAPTISIGLNRAKAIEPWRPGSEWEMAILANNGNFDQVEIINVGKLAPAPEPKSWFSRAEVRHPPPITDGTMTRRLNFAGLGARAKTIFAFCWHPSGEYLAVTAGDWESKDMRTHVVHVLSGEIAASTAVGTAGLMWSPDGRYCLLIGRDHAADPRFWDCHSMETTASAPLGGEAWVLDALCRGGLDGISFGGVDGLVSADGQRLLTERGVVLATISRSGSRIEAGDVVARIAKQSFTHAAWHPTDPACFATVGGPASPRLPEAHPSDHGGSHSGSLRIWRLASD